MILIKKTECFSKHNFHECYILELKSFNVQIYIGYCLKAKVCNLIYMYLCFSNVIKLQADLCLHLTAYSCLLQCQNQQSQILMSPVEILNMGTYEQTVQTLIRLLPRSSLIRVCSVSHSILIFWLYYCIIKPNCSFLSPGRAIVLPRRRC